MSDQYKTQKSTLPTLNTPIHVECQLLNHGVTSTIEAEMPAIFYNC